MEESLVVLNDGEEEQIQREIAEFSAAEILSASSVQDVAPPVPSVSNALTGLKADGASFLSWAIDSSIALLELADLPPLQTVDGLRGQKEHQIRDKIQIANSVLVLAANYGSKNDNKELVDICTQYAEKMKIIIKRLCL